MVQLFVANCLRQRGFFSVGARRYGNQHDVAKEVDMANVIDFEALLGAVLVVAHALQRFNTPPTNRLSTTALRYYVAAFCYCAFGIVLYVTLLNYPQVLSALGAKAKPSEISDELSPAL